MGMIDERIKCGSVTLAKWVCPYCKEENLTGYDSLQCSKCKRIYEDDSFSRVRFLASQGKRKHFSERFRDDLSKSQNHKCHWCGRDFGAYVLYKGVVRRLSPCIEHVSPWSFSFDNSDENLVAACQICNAWKTSTVFDSEDVCREFLLERWEKMIDTEKIQDVIP